MRTCALPALARNLEYMHLAVEEDPTLISVGYRVRATRRFSLDAINDQASIAGLDPMLGVQTPERDSSTHQRPHPSRAVHGSFARY